MTGDDPKCLDDLVRSSDTAGFKLRKAICVSEVAQIKWLELRKAICISEVAQIKWLELRMNGCGRKFLACFVQKKTKYKVSACFFENTL
jgi:hypothetical protein